MRDPFKRAEQNLRAEAPLEKNQAKNQGQLGDGPYAAKRDRLSIRILPPGTVSPPASA